jgi:hypothetical protein
MNLGNRVKNILLAPKAEWPVVAAEAAPPRAVLTGYVMILSAIGPLVAIVVSAGSATRAAIGQYAIALAMTFVVAWIADALAPSFGGTRDYARSYALVAYSWTPVWLGSAIAAIAPAAAPVIMLAALLYALYTLYVGAPLLGRADAGKSAGYTIVIVLCAIAAALVLGLALMPALFGASLLQMGRTWI